MMKKVKMYLQHLLRKCGRDIVPFSEFPPDLDEAYVQIYQSVQNATMTSPDRVYALIQAVHYLVRNDIPGDFVECGVWKGGSVMAMAESLLHLHCTDRDIYLYDTFQGMSAPSDVDVSTDGTSAPRLFSKAKIAEDSSDWCLAPLEEVKKNVYSTGYEKGRFHFVVGKVEDTIPDTMPERIALLRLDTDWYTSTKHELTHLFPRLSVHGVIIIDDYGYWKGVRRAVDEYITENDIRILLHRIDPFTRIGVKLA